MEQSKEDIQKHAKELFDKTKIAVYEHYDSAVLEVTQRCYMVPSLIEPIVPLSYKLPIEEDEEITLGEYIKKYNDTIKISINKLLVSKENKKKVFDYFEKKISDTHFESDEFECFMILSDLLGSLVETAIATVECNRSLLQVISTIKKFEAENKS